VNHAISSEERNWAMFANLAGLLIFVHIPFANVIAPLIIYFKVRGDNLSFALEHARSSLNFQITFSLFAFVAGIFLVACFVGTLGQIAVLGDQQQDLGPPLAFVASIFAWIGVWLSAVVVNVVLCILAAIAASSGRHFRYPAISFVR
jgi:uncharacterized Tic20 family protein